MDAFLNYEDALQKGQQPDPLVRWQAEDVFQQQSDMAEKSPETGLRATLQKMFPLLPAKTGQRENYLGRIGTYTRAEKDYNGRPEAYITSLMLTTVLRVGILVGGVLLLAFSYLSIKGVDIGPYMASALLKNHNFYWPFDHIFDHMGLVGLYALIFSKAMYYAALIIILFCYFLIWIYSPLLSENIDELQENFLKLDKLKWTPKSITSFSIGRIVGICMFYFTIKYSFVACLALFGGSISSDPSSIIWLGLSYIAILFSVFGGTIGLYAMLAMLFSFGVYLVRYRWKKNR